jgi:hypothetical protein
MVGNSEGKVTSMQLSSNIYPASHLRHSALGLVLLTQILNGYMQFFKANSRTIP